MKLVELQNISKVYNQQQANELVVLKELNLKIWDGDFLAIMGPSGSGKSTLLHLLGFLDQATLGVYLFKNQDVSKLSQNQLAKLRSEEVGLVFQSFNLLPRTSVLRNVQLPLVYSQEEAAYEWSERVLKQVGLWDKKDKLPNQLSGGEQQRVAIARALANRPTMILADEPTGNLDTKTGLEIMQLLSELNAFGHTIIVVTHDQNIAQFAHRIIQLKDGEIQGEQQRIHINYHPQYFNL